MLVLHVAERTASGEVHSKLIEKMVCAQRIRDQHHTILQH